MALVKQDCNEDLYCCGPDATSRETIESTLLRTGPAALLTRFEAKFILLRTEPDAECSIWREKWDALRWAPIEWFESFRDAVPGRAYGQKQFAVDVDSIDWNDFDLVISVDCAVPERVTRLFPQTVWAYYVRELKAPSYASSMRAPLPGQDLHLDHQFVPYARPSARHVVRFPYHFQYSGMFAELWPEDASGQERAGVFVDFHSARAASQSELDRLKEFGPVYAKTVDDDVFDPLSGERVPHLTVETSCRQALMSCKYHVAWCGRVTFGTARVEAIAAGCLTLAASGLDRTPFLQSSRTGVDDFEDMLHKLRELERSPAAFQRELSMQRNLVDYLCFVRPANELFDACDRVLHDRSPPSGFAPCQ